LTSIFRPAVHSTSGSTWRSCHLLSTMAWWVQNAHAFISNNYSSSFCFHKMLDFLWGITEGENYCYTWYLLRHQSLSPAQFVPFALPPFRPSLIWTSSWRSRPRWDCNAIFSI
jgi:hypothetical protein